MQFVPVALPAKHLLGALPLRTAQDSAWLGRPRPVRFAPHPPPPPPSSVYAALAFLVAADPINDTQQRPPIIQHTYIQYGPDRQAGLKLVAEIVKRGWDRDLCLSKHRMTLGCVCVCVCLVRCIHTTRCAHMKY